jgi:hypothetical protein
VAEAVVVRLEAVEVEEGQDVSRPVLSGSYPVQVGDEAATVAQAGQGVCDCLLLGRGEHPHVEEEGRGETGEHGQQRGDAERDRHRADRRQVATTRRQITVAASRIGRTIERPLRSYAGSTAAWGSQAAATAGASRLRCGWSMRSASAEKGFA